ncbi:MAG: hypothetical protein ACXW5U_03620 [Thermoanaerobaculia bacterium]
MPHEVNLITTIAAGLGLAMVFGFIAARLRLPPLVGYLRQEHIGEVFMGEHELAKAMTQHVLDRMSGKTA